MILTTVHLYILSFFLFLFFDYLIRKNVFGHYFYSLYNSAFGNMKYGFLVFTLVFYIFIFILIYTLDFYLLKGNSKAFKDLLISLISIIPFGFYFNYINLRL